MNNKVLLAVGILIALITSSVFTSVNDFHASSKHIPSTFCW
jgi:hypothetical protein